MIRIMLVTFLFLGWAFYELSGGSEFEAPEVARVVELEQFDVADLPKEEPSARARVTGQSTQSPEDASDTNASDEAAVTEVSLTVPDVSDANQPQETSALPPRNAEILRITGSRVNMRSGPGTDFQVVTQLRRDQRVQLLQDPGDGWVKLRTEDGRFIGWMAKRFTATQ